MDNIQSASIICRGGLNTHENHMEMSSTSPGAARHLLNYEPSIYGGYRRIEGYQPFDPAHPIVGPAECEGRILTVALYRDNASASPYVIAARKDLGANTYSFWRHIDGTGWQKMTHPARAFSSGGKNVTRIRHAQFDFGSGDHIAFVDGVNGLIVWDGSTWTEPAGDQILPAPSLIEVFSNHLFLAGDTSAPAAVSHSAPLAWNDWTVGAGAGQLVASFPVVQIRPFRDGLFLFGNNAIRRVRADAASGFLQDPITSDVGCIAPDSVMELGGDLVFLAPDGLRPVSGTSRIGDVELETLSRKISSRILDVLRFVDLEELQGVVVRSKNQVRFFLSAPDVHRVDTPGLLAGVVDREGLPGWEFSDLVGIRATCATSAYVGREEYVLHGDYDGYVYRQEQGNTLAGDDMVAIYSTPYLDFGAVDLNKKIRRIDTFVRPEGAFEAAISLSFDWGDQYAALPSSYSARAEGQEVTWGGRAAIYGGQSVAYGGTDKPVSVNNVQGSGNSVSLTFVSVGDYAPHTLQGLVFRFTPQGNR